MTTPVFSYDSQLPTGLNFRKSRTGPELNLVNSFLEEVINNQDSSIANVAFFIEPKIDSGIPDIVMVEYDPSCYENWQDERFYVRPHDLKILHHLYSCTAASSPSIEASLGLDSKKLLRSLEVLLDAGLIERRSGLWQPVALTQAYGIRRLVAIEAKVKDWQGAFQQARLNQWFASETFVLLPFTDLPAKLVERSEAWGVGVLCYTGLQDGIKELCSSRKDPLPACYVSWVFNESLGRFLYTSR
jgi:hypothetical protein